MIDMQLIVPKLKDREDEFNHLQKVIKEKREFLRHKQQSIRNISKTNHFLEKVNDDYTKYHDYIVKQENEKMGALTTLRDYVKDLTTSGTLTEQNLSDAKMEQKKIINEMKIVKQNIDDIVDKNKKALQDYKNKKYEPMYIKDV